MSIAIKGIGLATAQGNAAEILQSHSRRGPKELPWSASKWNVSRVCYSATGIDSSLSGMARWQKLIKRAITESFDEP